MMMHPPETLVLVGGAHCGRVITVTDRECLYVTCDGGFVYLVTPDRRYAYWQNLDMRRLFPPPAAA